MADLIVHVQLFFRVEEPVQEEQIEAVAEAPVQAEKVDTVAAAFTAKLQNITCDGESSSETMYCMS